MLESRVQLNIKIDEKTRWLGTLAARYRGMTLAEFVEAAIRKALEPDAMTGDEPTPGLEPKRNQTSPLWNEALWNEEEATRLYCLSAAPGNLLSATEKKVVTRISRQAARDGRKLTLQTFTQYFNTIQEAK
jgi:hypothetical protein